MSSLLKRQFARSGRSLDPAVCLLDLGPTSRAAGRTADLQQASLRGRDGIRVSPASATSAAAETHGPTGGNAADGVSPNPACTSVDRRLASTDHMGRSAAARLRLARGALRRTPASPKRSPELPPAPGR